MIKFSETTQAFYSGGLNYIELPSDVMDISDEQHQDLLTKLNEGRHIFADLSASEPRPSFYHQWVNGAWLDDRSEEDKRTAYLATLRPLSRRQFKLVLLENNLLDQIESTIEQLADEALKSRLLIEYQDGTSFERNNPSIMVMCNQLGLNDAQIDQLWEQAMSL